MKKTILIIVENNPVPLDVRVWREACSLRDSGYDVITLCPKGDGYATAHQMKDGIHIYRHPTTKEGHLHRWEFLWEYGSALFWEFVYAWWIYFRHGFHVIQGCNPPDDIFLVALPFKLFGVKYIFDHHDVNPELYFSKYERKDFLYMVQLWLEAATFRCSDVVMSTNNSYRDIALTRGGRDKNDVFVVRNGVDLKTFRAVPPNPALKHGKRFLVGYVGKMSTQEGIDILIDVVLRFKDIGRSDVHFTCVGGGPGLATFRNLAAERGVDEMMTFTGRIPDAELLEILSTADVCVNPDKPCSMNSMSTMIKIMEYMALGKPIVQFESKEGRFSAQSASLYAADEHPAADFAQKLLYLLDNPDERKKMGQFGRKRVEEELAWQYSVDHLCAAYERAFSKRQKLIRAIRAWGHDSGQ
jgi:glycosyltransferase involved in cell wall biosynthesis